MPRDRLIKVAKVVGWSVAVLGGLAAMAAIGYVIYDHHFNPQSDCEYVETRLPDRQGMLDEIDTEIEEFQSQGHDVYGWQQDAIQAKVFLEQARELWHDERCAEAKNKLKGSGELIHTLRAELGLVVAGVGWWFIAAIPVVLVIVGTLIFMVWQRRSTPADIDNNS